MAHQNKLTICQYNSSNNVGLNARIFKRTRNNCSFDGFEEMSDSEPKPFSNKEDFIRSYQQQILSQTELRDSNRDLLKKPSLQFLRSAKLNEILSSVCLEVLEQNVRHDVSWEPRKALGVCRTLEDLMLKLADAPWRKEFHTFTVGLQFCIHMLFMHISFQLFSGYYRTIVAKSLLDADRLLELGGYEMDLSGQKMSLRQAPIPDRILRAAAELFLLAVELQVQAEILCLVQAEGFKPCSVLKCRTTLVADNESSAKWIRSHCSPGNGTIAPPQPQAVADPVYSEISDRSSSSDSLSRRSLKSSSNETVSSGSVLDRNENLKEKPEPIYSIVRKTPKSPLAMTDSSLYGFDPNHLHALRRSPNLPVSESSPIPPSPSPSDPSKSPVPFPVTFSTFRPPHDPGSGHPPRYVPPDSHYENIHLLAIGERTEKRPRPPALSPIPVQLPSPPSPGATHLYANVTNDDQRKFSGITATISSKYDALPSRRVTSPPNGHEGPMVVVGNRWQCLSCTSFNLQGTEICDICGKSRLKGAELAPLSTGGAQCPQCTLINPKGAQSCGACDRILSMEEATYI